jgi:hypothetical protein
VIIPQSAVIASKGWTGAEIEMAVVKAVSLMEDEGMDADAALLAAVERVTPSTADIDLMTLLALNETNDIDLVPERMREQLRNRKGLNQKIQEERKAAEEAGGRGARTGMM